MHNGMYMHMYRTDFFNYIVYASDQMRSSKFCEKVQLLLITFHVNGSFKSVAGQPSPGRRPSERTAHAQGRGRFHMALHGDLEADGALERTVHLVARRADSGCTVDSAGCSTQHELVLLHANHRRLRLLVNLAAQLQALNIQHTLALGFTPALCSALHEIQLVRVHCAHSSYLREASLSNPTRQLLSAKQAAWLPAKHIAWLQRFYYLRRLLELRVRVLALDTDMAIRADPFPVLRDPSLFGRFQLVTTFDFKGGFANTNIGFVCLQNATLGGSVHGLFLEFEARVRRALLLPLPPPRRRAQYITQFVWDQNLFNKVLLSAMAGHAAYLPDGADASWTGEHKSLLRARLYWTQPVPRVLASRLLNPWPDCRSAALLRGVHPRPHTTHPGATNCTSNVARLVRAILPARPIRRADDAVGTDALQLSPCAPSDAPARRCSDARALRRERGGWGGRDRRHQLLRSRRVGATRASVARRDGASACDLLPSPPHICLCACI